MTRNLTLSYGVTISSSPCPMKRVALRAPEHVLRPVHRRPHQAEQCCPDGSHGRSADRLRPWRKGQQRAAAVSARVSISSLRILALPATPASTRRASSTAASASSTTAPSSMRFSSFRMRIRIFSSRPCLPRWESRVTRTIRSGRDPRLDRNNGISTVPITPPATPKPPYQPFVARWSTLRSSDWLGLQCHHRPLAEDAVLHRSSMPACSTPSRETWF